MEDNFGINEARKGVKTIRNQIEREDKAQKRDREKDVPSGLFPEPIKPTTKSHWQSKSMEWPIWKLQDGTLQHNDFVAWGINQNIDSSDNKYHSSKWDGRNKVDWCRL